MRALATSKGSPSPVQQTEPATPEAVSCQLILGELPSRATTSPERGPTTSPELTFHDLAFGAVAVYSPSGSSDSLSDKIRKIRQDKKPNNLI